MLAAGAAGAAWRVLLMQQKVSRRAAVRVQRGDEQGWRMGTAR